MHEEEQNCRVILLEDGSRFDLDQLECDQLLNDLKEWDYPIFDLLDRYTDRVLSTVISNFLNFYIVRNSYILFDCYATTLD